MRCMTGHDRTGQGTGQGTGDRGQETGDRGQRTGQDHGYSLLILFCYLTALIVPVIISYNYCNRP